MCTVQRTAVIKQAIESKKRFLSDHDHTRFDTKLNTLVLQHERSSRVSYKPHPTTQDWPARVNNQHSPNKVMSTTRVLRWPIKSILDEFPTVSDTHLGCDRGLPRSQHLYFSLIIVHVIVPTFKKSPPPSHENNLPVLLVRRAHIFIAAINLAAMYGVYHLNRLNCEQALINIKSRSIQCLLNNLMKRQNPFIRRR